MYVQASKKSQGLNIPHLAIAIKCNTALVDPPKAMTMAIALRSDLGVIMSRGFMSIFIKSSKYFPARRHSSNFNGSSAGVEELFGTRERRKELIKKQITNNSTQRIETSF